MLTMSCTYNCYLPDKCTKRVRDQIDGYSDSLASLHNKLDQVIAYCVDKKEREEVMVKVLILWTHCN